MTAKPAIPPKPKALTAKTLVAKPPPDTADTVTVISSPFATVSRPDPQFFYSNGPSSGFRSYLAESHGPKAKLSTETESVNPPSSANGNQPSSARGKNSLARSGKIRTSTNSSAFYTQSQSVVGVECGSAFAEGRRKFSEGGSERHASLHQDASQVSPHPSRALSPTEKILGEQSTDSLPTSGDSSSTEYSTDAVVAERSVEDSNQPINRPLSPLNMEDVNQPINRSLSLLSMADANQSINQSLTLLSIEAVNQPINHSSVLLSVSKDVFLEKTEETFSVPSRDSVISCGTVSSTDSEKSTGIGNEGENLPVAQKIASEIVETEFFYLKSLRLLLFEFPLAVKNSLPDEEVQALLKGLPQIEKLSEDFYEDLKVCLNNYKMEQKIAKVFLKKGKVLLLYVSYVNDFEKLIDTYRNLLRKYPNFAEAVAKFEASPVCKKIPLVEYFHKPIQRLPRYPLLLGTYLRALEEDHPDREDTKRALDLVSDVTSQANTTLASVEKVHKLLWYQARTVGYTFLRLNRMFIREGILKKLSRKAPQDRTVLLCSDAIICGEFDGITRTKFTVNAEYPLTEIMVEHSIDKEYFDRDIEFGIYSTKKSFVFQANSVEERNSWLSAISRATEDLQKQNMRNIPLRTTKNVEPLVFAPIWIPDYRVFACQLCKKHFNLFRRYHHCRLCGYAVCSSCSPHEVGIDYKDNRNKRVCDACFRDPKHNPDLRQ